MDFHRCVTVAGTFLRALAWLYWLPIRASLWLVRLWVAQRVTTDELACRVCGAAISLLGLWQCGPCGYSFYGFYFGRCEFCGAIPPYIECERCGASTINPALVGQGRWPLDFTPW